MGISKHVIEDEAGMYLRMASEHYGREFKLHGIRLDLQGRTAGQAICRRGRYTIRLNGRALKEHPDYIMNNTIPHEVAHIVQRQLAPKSKPHGRVWQEVMSLFGKPANVAHSLPLDYAEGTFTYTCGCMEHKVSKIVHGKMLRGQRRVCRHCHNALSYVEGSEPVAAVAEAPRPTNTRSKGAVDQTWAVCQQLYAELGVDPWKDRARYMRALAQAGVNRNTAGRQFNEWRKTLDT